MKKVIRILCALLALAMLTGCTAPKLVLGGTPDTAGTVADKTITTGEYLAYLYNAFYEQYYNTGYYQYAAYGYDVWSQEFTYNEDEDDEQSVTFGEMIKLTAKDTILRQEALRQMLAEEKIEWDEEALKDLEEDLKEMADDALISLGINNENYINMNKNTTLNEQSLFYGRYREGGTKAVSEKDRKAYFDKNYLSYKMIAIDLTDDEGKDLKDADKKKITDQLKGYLDKYNKDKNFEAIVDEYNKSVAAEGEKVEASKDEDNRQNVDATQVGDDDMVKAIRGVKVGEAKVVTYGTTAALVLRLDINDPKDLFKDETDNILYGMKYEDFDKEVEKKIEGITINLKQSVVNKCDPQNFLTDAQ